MVNAEAERIHDAIIASLEKTNKRGIFLTGWGQKKPAFDNSRVLYLQEIPHEFLFPKCQAVIHHGGAGTTVAGLWAGIPNIVVPHAADQYFWAKRVADIGYGLQPITVKRLSANRLAAALTTSQETVIHSKVQSIGRKIQGEKGVETAMRVIETIL